jgi:hypothetical protein
MAFLLHTSHVDNPFFATVSDAIAPRACRPVADGEALFFVLNSVGITAV